MKMNKKEKEKKKGRLRVMSLLGEVVRVVTCSAFHNEETVQVSGIPQGLIDCLHSQDSIALLGFYLLFGGAWSWY